MMVRKLLFIPVLLSLLLLKTGRTSAQSSDLGCWIAFNSSLNFNKSIGVHVDVQLRQYEFINDFEQSIVRPSLFYNLKEGQVQFSAGFAWAHTEAYRAGSENKRVFDERRLHQQVLFRTRTGRFYINHRYRLEERFFSDRSNLRFRYQVNMQWPLNKPHLEKGAVYLLLMDELFVNDRSPVFDRNRLLLSMGYSFSPSLRLEAGLLLQMFENSHRAQSLFTLVHSLNL
ncbi:MAG: DUF2490 domain-containing protein [Bacteroidia bacterium]|nr:DUF2490 domain-containing protein [Bacteroidia bacterium]